MVKKGWTARRSDNLRAHSVHERVTRAIPPPPAGGPDPPAPTWTTAAAWTRAWDTASPEFVAQAYANLDPVDNFPDEITTFDAVQATGANQPLCITAFDIFGGRDVIRCVDATDHLRTTDWTDIPQPFTWAVIGRRRINKAAGAFIDGLQATTKHAIAVISDVDVHLDGGDGAPADLPVNLTGEAPHLIVVEFNGASSKCWIGGRLVWTGTLAADASEGLTLFDSAEISAGAKSLTGGEICSVGFKSGAGWQLTAPELANLVTLSESAGCFDFTTGLCCYPDAWSRAAAETDGAETVTLKITPTAGNVLEARCSANASESVHAVTDDVGGTWVKKVGADQASRGVSIWTKVAAGTESTVTFTAGTGYVRIQVDEIPNATTTGIVTNSGDDGGAGVTTITPSVTTGAGIPNALVSAVVFMDNNSGLEVSWTNAWEANQGTTDRFHTAHHIETTAGVKSSVFTWTTSRRALWAAIAIPHS